MYVCECVHCGQAGALRAIHAHADLAVTDEFTFLPHDTALNTLCNDGEPRKNLIANLKFAYKL